MKKNKRGKILFIIVFLLGLSILLFPFVSQFIHWRASRLEINVYQKEVQNLRDEEKEHRLKLAHGYNETLVQGRISDPWTELQIEGRKEYARMLEVHEKIGFIEIPAIKEEIPIYAGTSESVLQKGVGHMEGTSLPVGGKSTHAVLTAHRGLPTARLFTDLDKMKVGDHFLIHVLGKIFLYEVFEIEVIEPHQFEKLQIVSGEDRITLLTCTPYMVNSHRLLVKGERKPYTPPEKKKITSSEEVREAGDKWCFYLILLLILLFIVGLCLYVRKKLKGKKD